MGLATGFGLELDALTLERARRGERAAFAALYDRYSRAAYTLALRLTGRADAAEDVVQEAFIKAMERIGSYRGEAPFGAWLKRLVANAAIDRLRLDRRWVDGDDAALEEPVAAMAEQRHEALGLLARLAPAARSVLVLHELEGYSHAEMAQLFGRSESWSKSLLSRAIARLRQSLEQEQAA
jgi:RNA polymerase sigma-70 factor (ECF subfamily)